MRDIKLLVWVAVSGLALAGCDWPMDTPLVCGDGQKAQEEECDGASFGGQTCKGLGFDGGKLACTSACKLNRAGCYRCGDGIKGAGETCDKGALDNKSCKDLKASGGADYAGGTLACKSDCSGFDTAGCYRCGDNKITGADACDGTDLGGKTCKGVGFEGGTLACKSDCSWYDTKGCYRCGDGKKGGAEECDVSDMGGATCQSKGFVTGGLQCKAGCTIDTSGCSPYQWSWATNFGGTTPKDMGQALVTDSSGNTYIAGFFAGSAKFGSTTLTSTSPYDSDLFVAKLDKTGKPVWVEKITGKGEEEVFSMDLDTKGNIYIAGWFTGGPMTFGNLQVKAIGNAEEAFVAKMNSSGKFLWVTVAGGPNKQNRPTSVVDDLGNVTFIVNFRSSITIGGKTLKGTAYDCAVARLDSAGKVIWAKSLSHNGNCFSLVQTSSGPEKGTLNIAGSFAGKTVVFGSKTLTNTNPAGNSYDGFIARMKNDGQMINAWSYGGAESEYVFGLRMDSANKLIVMGSFTSKMTIGGKTLTPSPKYGNLPYEMYVIKYDLKGKPIWAAQGGSKYTVFAKNLALDSKDNIYVMGYFDSMMEFGGKTIFGNVTDIFMAKYNSAGIPQWALSAGGPGDDRAYGFEIAGKTATIIGRCMDWARFGKTTLKVTPYNYWDIFVSRLQIAP